MKKVTALLLGLTKEEYRTLKELNTPEKIQSFVSQLRINFEQQGPTTLSVREVLRLRKAHCIEGAMLAACAFWVNGERPLLLDLRAEHDYDHVIAVYKQNGLWGAISKSNHAQLRYRDPIYRTLRELALSYFHEYYNEKGEKTLRAYSRVFDLRGVPAHLWVTSGKESWDVGSLLDDIRHYSLFPRTQIPLLQHIDEMEERSAQLREFSR